MFRRFLMALFAPFALLLAQNPSLAQDLSGRFQTLAPGASVNLSAEGVLDWAHWGLSATNDFNHKNGATMINNVTLVGSGSLALLTTNTTHFAWSNGTPTLTATNVASGLRVTGDANGFQFTVPADTTPRRLKVYVSALAAQGQLEASVSDGSSVDYTDASVNSVFELADGCYTINYSAAFPGQTLTVKFTALTTYDATGFVSLEAGTLATNIPPTVSINSPTNNTAAFATDNLTLTANASDADGTITTVEFYRNSVFLIDEATNSPYSVVWQNLPSGTNVLTAVAYDNEGGQTESAPVTVIVQTNHPPSVTITNPVSDASFIAPATITINASASDPGGSVTKVEFFQGTTKLGESTTSPFSYTWSGVGMGIYSLTARATDNGGATATSAAVNIFVTTNGGVLSASVESVPQGSEVNLTAEGTNDWVQWGRYSELSIARKAGVAAQISDFSTVGGSRSDVYQFSDNYNGYTWSDGTPIAAATNTTTGVYYLGLDKGFSLTAPADTSPRTLKLYVGTYGARGKLVAYLSDLTAPVYVDSSLVNGGNGPGVVYTLNYAAASAGKTLVARYTEAEKYQFDGNVTLQAATLSSTNAPPAVSLINPVNRAVFAASANILLQAAASDPGGAVSKVEFYRNGTKLGETTSSPYNFTWTNASAGSYALTARATDNSGQTYTTPATSVYVTNAGGLLVGTLATPSNVVSLTAEGRVDWTHWGYDLPSTGNPSVQHFNRKRNVTQRISNYSSIGNGTPLRYTDNLAAFNWTDGIPTLNVASTTTGFYQTGLTNGFQITVPADTSWRHLRVFVGVYRARGKFEATLSDMSAVPYVDTSMANFNRAVGVYTLNYAAASAGKTLTVKYTSDAVFDEVSGNVTLQAAALASSSPGLSLLTWPPANPMAFSFPTDLGMNYTVQYSDSFSPANWQSLTNFTGDGSDRLITAPDAAAVPQRFFRVKLTP